ncbi:hypothetical protein EYF80_002943 [Liparis tanakae]|uniref:Uncharacterized protein n=1 Tax=Liparis tanakae TaxID=230148 RepID=A0A4Z2J9H1_9TELE|nr:hypothetical protein EYF80_002943 [Liparis tanakae]
MVEVTSDRKKMTKWVEVEILNTQNPGEMLHGKSAPGSQREAMGVEEEEEEKPEVGRAMHCNKEKRSESWCVQGRQQAHGDTRDRRPDKVLTGINSHFPAWLCTSQVHGIPGKARQ